MRNPHPSRHRPPRSGLIRRSYSDRMIWRKSPRSSRARTGGARRRLGECWDDRRGAQGDQGGRIPGGDASRRRRGVDPGRPPVLIEAGAGLGSGHRRRPVRGGRRDDRAPRPPRSGAGPTWSSRSRSRSRRSGRMLRRGQTVFTYFHFAADEALTRAVIAERDHRHRLRDPPRRPGQPAAADPDERGRRPDEHPGGGEVPGTAPGRARDLARGRAGRRAGRGRRSWAAGSSGRTPPRSPPGWGRTSGSSTSTSTGSATSTTSCRPTSRPSTPTGTRSSRSIERADLVIGAVLITGARRPAWCAARTWLG